MQSQSTYELYYKESRDKTSKDKHGSTFTCIAFTPDGSQLLVATAIGTIIIIDPETSAQVKQPNMQELSVVDKSSDTNKTSRIEQMIVDDDGKFFACSDNQCCISLFKHSKLYDDEDQKVEEWWFIGKIRTHVRGITSISFGYSYDENNQKKHRLFSIGKDRRLFEYETHFGDEYGVLKVMKCIDIELEATPTSCIWYPTIDIKEGLILTANDEYKMKLWNPTTQNSRRTCLGPTYGGAINKLKLLSLKDRHDKFLLYSTAKKVIGLIKLPLDGNPNKTMGLIAHPDEVTDICCSPDGKYVFTCGGSDLSVNMWAVDVSPIEQAIAIGGDGIEPFINLIEGGREGQTFQDMNDYFYYSMIRSKKENTTRTRKLDGKVPVDEIANLMRAMGYYPTKQEAANIADEVRFQFLAENGQPTTEVKLDEFIKLFVNHRPVYGIGQNNIEEAFAALCSYDGDPKKIRRDTLKKMLMEEGEAIKPDEMSLLLSRLTGKSEIEDALLPEITAQYFAEKILGFEEAEDEEDEAEQEQLM